MPAFQAQKRPNVPFRFFRLGDLTEEDLQYLNSIGARVTGPYQDDKYDVSYRRRVRSTRGDGYIRIGELDEVVVMDKRHYDAYYEEV